MKEFAKYLGLCLSMFLGGMLVFYLLNSNNSINTPNNSYISPAEDSLRRELSKRDSTILALKDSVKTELDTIYKTRIRYKEAELTTLATPDSMQEKLFLKNYPPSDSFSAVLSHPIPIPSIRSANVAFVKLEAATVENKHLWSITEKQGLAIESLQQKCLTYNDLALAISAERDSCALDNGALMEEIVEQDMVIERQGKWLKYGGFGVGLYILARVGVKLLF